MSKESSIIIKNIDKITIILLNRPKALNALSINLLNELRREIKKIKKNPNIRVLILGSSNLRAFSVGADLKERINMNLEETYIFLNLINNVFNEISTISVPTIAAIDGLAFGGGLELALSCDIRVMLQNTKVGLTECSLGVIPGAGGTQRLSRIVGLSAAKEMIFCSKIINSCESYRIGLTNRVAESSENTLDIAINIANKIIKNAPLSVVASKKAIDIGYQLNINDGLSVEKMCYSEVIDSKDKKEGLNAFINKKIPNYTGC